MAALDEPNDEAPTSDEQSDPLALGELAPTAFPEEEIDPLYPVEEEEDEEEPEGWDNPEAWEQLLYLIWYKKCTPFLGAGACAGVLPMGKTIAEAWAKKYGYPFPDSGNLPRVAQFMTVMHGPLLPRLKLMAQFENKVTNYEDPNEPHRVVAGLALPVYITTNYDSLMTNELIRTGRKPVQECCQWHRAREISKTQSKSVVSAIIPTPEEPVVFHLHGNFQELTSMVLTENDYLNFLINISEVNVIPSYIDKAFSNERAFLFIGYSLEDMSFKVLFRKFEQQITSNPGDRHIAVQLHGNKDLSATERKKQREFLQKQFGTLNVRIYWGKARTFARSLRERWEAFVLEQNKGASDGG